MSVTPFFRWHDLWVGAYYDRKARAIYVCPLPTVGLRIALSGCFWRHRWSGWVEHLGRKAIAERFRVCERCGKVDIGA